MRRNRNNRDRNIGNRNNGNELTEEELDELLTADLKLSVSDDICISEDLIERTLAAVKRGDEPRTPIRREEEEWPEGESGNPEGRKHNLLHYGKNMAAAAAVLLVLFAGSYAFHNYLSDDKKSTDSASGGAMPNLQATSAATAIPENEAVRNHGALTAESGAADGFLPDTTAGGAAEFSGGEEKEFGAEACLPSDEEADGNSQEHVTKAPVPYGKDDKKSTSFLLTSLSELAYCAETIEKADAVTVGGEESEEITLTGEQAEQLALIFSEEPDTEALNGNRDLSDSGREDAEWIITVFYGEEARLTIKVGDRIEIDDKKYLIEDIHTLTDLLESFMR